MVTGKACPVILTVKEKKNLEHIEEMKSLQLLKDNGLVQQEIVKKDNCVKFEITEEPGLQSQSLKANALAPLKRVPLQFLKTTEKSISSQDQIIRKLEEAQKRKDVKSTRFISS
jgi:hypothetical protein